MIRVLMILSVLLSLCLAGAAYAQTPLGDEVHYEGYTVGSNPTPPGVMLNGRGLVTHLYPPLVWKPNAFEYTWVIGGLVSRGSVLTDSQYTTYYDGGPGGSNSFYRIFEDPSFDASGTFYNCPSDIQGFDPRYSDGALYLQGHFVPDPSRANAAYVSTFDIHAATYGQGTFMAFLNWDTGTHIGDLPLAQRGGWTFGGSTVSVFSCIPKVAQGNQMDYDQAMTGRVYRLTTKAQGTTWGALRTMYR